MADIKATFAGSIPGYYDECLGPAYFDACGEALAGRAPGRRATCWRSPAARDSSRGGSASVSIRRSDWSPPT